MGKNCTMNIFLPSMMQLNYEKKLESVISHSALIEFKKGCKDYIQPDLDTFSSVVSKFTSNTQFRAIENECSTLAKVTSGVVSGVVSGGVVAAGAGAIAVASGLVTLSVATGGILLLGGLFGVIGSMAYSYIVIPRENEGNSIPASKNSL